MKIHTTAKPYHYDKEAKHYDKFNEENSKVINTTIEKILKKNCIKTILDLTCGTGSQVFWLAHHGYQVVGSDISQKMLKIAKDKAKQQKLALQFIQGDMRTVKAGLFDAVITIFNAIGHLTKQDFEQALQNINSNLTHNGLYIFDIFNLDYLLHGNNITKLTIDWQTINNGQKVRNIQYSTVNEDGILTSYDLYFQQQSSQKVKTVKSSQTLQVYKAHDLEIMLQRNGFKVVEQLSINGSTFDKHASDRILVVAQKNTPQNFCEVSMYGGADEARTRNLPF